MVGSSDPPDPVPRAGAWDVVDDSGTVGRSTPSGAGGIGGRGSVGDTGAPGCAPGTQLGGHGGATTWGGQAAAPRPNPAAGWMSSATAAPPTAAAPRADRAI